MPPPVRFSPPHPISAACLSVFEDFNEKSFTRANQHICDEWSRELMQTTNKELFPKVKAS